ncbi:MAG: glycosyltransferase, partial [Candidatus Promineifilaceae bacterium]
AIRPHGLAAHLISGVPWMSLSVNPSAFALPQNPYEWEQAGRVERTFYDNIRPILDRAVREAGGSRLMPGWYYGCLWAPRVLLGSSPAFSAPDRDLLQPFATIEQPGFWYWQDPAWESWRPSAELEAFCERSPLVLAFSSQPLEEPGAILGRFARAAAELGMPLLVQRGWADFGPAHLPPEIDPGDVFFLDYAPHDWLFERAAAAIQHGGIGSLARALRQYCPLVVAPFGNDQFYNAARITELGVGISLHPFEATVEEIKAAIGHVRSRPVRLRARLLGRRLREEDGIAGAADLIEAALAQKGDAAVFPAWKRLSVDEAGARETAVSKSIPHVIHHSWKDDNIPEQFQAWYESWRSLHPDWEFRLWTDEDCRALVAGHYAWFLPIYDDYSEPIKRADAARYFILHRHGGLYVDLDYEALRPLDDLLQGKELVLTTEPPSHLQRHPVKRFLRRMVCNALMASRPGHPFWEHVFELLVAWGAAPGPLDAAGPFMLSRAYATFGEPETITLEPYQRLCPIDSTAYWPSLPAETKDMILRDAYALHHWYGSWWIDPVVSEGPVAAQVMESGRPVAASRRTSREELLAHSAKTVEKPLVSCLMVTRDRPLQAELAVRLFQKQSYAERELIILDDGTSDALQAWIEANPDPRIAYTRLPDEARPLGELRSLALEQAKGAYVAQWDDDDLSAPRRPELQVAAISLFGANACLLARELIWMPAAKSLARSTYRLWEGSALLPREALHDFPPLRRGEDTAVIEAIVAGERVVALDMPELYVYVFRGGNAFSVEHWLAHLREATMRYEGFRYEPALAEIEAWMGVNMRRLGDYLASAGRRTAPDPVGEVPPVEVASTAAEMEREPLFKPLAEVELPPVLILTPVKDAAPYLATYLAGLRRLD